MDQKAHWNAVYQQKAPEQVSWYRPHLEISLRLLERAGLTPRSRLIDIGAGVSTLVDDVVARKIAEITALDISGQALAVAKARLGAQATQVRWIEGDILQATLEPAHYDLWHDRAVFHFLTDPDHRRKYAAALTRALKPGGQAVIATFSLQGPPRCSGLDVVRYSAEGLLAELGGAFRLAESLEEEHRTPAGVVQRFLYCRLEKISSAR